MDLKVKKRIKKSKFIISILISFIYFGFNIYTNFSSNRYIKRNNDIENNTKYINRNFIKYNKYKIYMNKIEDFYKSENLIFLPNKIFKEKCFETLFFKPKYPKKPYKYIKFQNKKLTLKLGVDRATFFSVTNNTIRERYLKKLGLKFDNSMKIDNLYLAPFEISTKFLKRIKHFIIDKSQKISKFLNHEEYSSKSLLYINYKIFENKYPLEFNYMLET